ncbi:MAG: hypothetical protein V4510_12985 [bacterium]
MAANEVFRVYKDEETMLKVYDRRLRIADRKFDVGKDERESFMDRYANKVEDDQVNEDGHRVTVTSGIGIIDTMYASMTAVDVQFILEQIGHGTQVQALVATRGLNQAWRDTKGQKRAKKAIKDSLLVDVGWAKVYYDYVEDVEMRDIPQEALEEQLKEYKDLHGLDEVTEEDIAAGVASEELKLTETVPIVLRDRVCVDYVPWDLIRYDPSAKQIEDVRWVAQYTLMPEAEVKGNPAWEQFVKDRYGARKGPKMLDELEGDCHISVGMDMDTELGELGEDDTNDDSRVTVVEMWDFETGLVTVFPYGNQELVLHQRINPLMMNLDLEDRNPFKPLIIRDDPQQFEGLGDMRIIQPALEELDEYRSNAATYVARTIPKFFGPESAMTDAGKQAFKSATWGEYVGINDGYSKDQIGQVQIPSLPQEAFSIPEQVQYEMKEATGASEPMRGVFPTRRTTATETQIVTGKGEERQAERRSALEDWYTAIARCMLQLMQVYYDQERMMRYTDDTGQEFAWKWTKEDIAMDCDLLISLTPKENLTRDQRVQRAMGFMNLALPLPETDRGELLKFVAREMGFRDEDIRAMVKSDKEVQMKEQQDQAASFATQPQPFANSPQGLGITPK